jgi:hypothetical protein
VKIHVTEAREKRGWRRQRPPEPSNTSLMILNLIIRTIRRIFLIKNFY